MQETTAPRLLAVPVRAIPEMAGIGITSVYGAIKDGKLVARKLGRRTVVRVADLEAWLAAMPEAKGTPSFNPAGRSRRSA